MLIKPFDALSAVRVAKADLRIAPLRSGKLGAEAAKAWDAFLDPAQQRLKARHTAGGASQFEDAYPFLMMRDDLVKGPYRDAFQLSRAGVSPEGDLVGDAHLTNFGLAQTLDAAKRWVYTVVDWTKAGRGPLENDAKRLAATAVITAERFGIPKKEIPKVAASVADAYFAALKSFADSGVKPSGFVTAEELHPQSPVRALIQTTEQNPERFLQSYVRDSGDRFLPSRRLTHKGERAAVLAAFEKYRGRLPSQLQQSIQVLDVGREVPLGGSNSGLTRYFVLGRVTQPGQAPATRVFEIKRGVPAPSQTRSSKASKVDVKQTVRIASEGTTIDDPYLGYLKLRGGQYVVTPSVPEQPMLDLRTLSSEELQLASRESAVALARFHAQSVDLPSLRAWLSAMDPDEAKAKLVSFAMTYARQAELDTAAVRKAL